MDNQEQLQGRQVQNQAQNMILCISCKTNNRSIAKFCKECGEIMQRGDSGAGVTPGNETTQDDIVGLEDVKKKLSSIINTIKINNEKKSMGLPVTPLYLHSVFKGDTGTGKTMLGRYFAQEFKKIGAVSKGTILEIDNETLGREKQDIHAAIRNWIEKARGGILFFDEMHKSVETISAIVKALGTAGEDIIVIVSGMKGPIDEYLEKNKEEKQRFGFIIDFKNYTLDELHQIALLQLHSLHYNIDEAAVSILKEYIRVTMYSGKSEFKNAWLIEREIIPNVLNRQSNRLTAEGSGHSVESLAQITAADIPDEGIKRKTPEEVLAEMDELVGMDEIKAEIKKLAHLKSIQEEEEKHGIKSGKMGMHMVITGNPGTGKTTVARILGELFNSIGLLPSKHVVETERKDFVAEFVGQTAPKTAAVIEKAKGGVLFLDEAYSLTPADAGNDFGGEAIATLIKALEDDRGNFIFIAAGYKKEMDRFINANPGIQRRIKYYFHLPDYKPDQLYRIFCIMVKKENRILSPEAEAKAIEVFKDMYNRRGLNFGNGGDVRNVYDLAVTEQAARIGGMKPEERTSDTYKTILPEDIKYKLPEQLSVNDILSQLDSLVGMEDIKKDVRDLVIFANMQMKREAAVGKKSYIVPHIILTGNPGTGKTTVARMIGKLFHSIGILPSDRFIEVDKSGLVAQYVGQTAPKVNEVVDRALGGVLFIDEAYMLAPLGQTDSYNQDAIATLMKRMSDDKGKFVVIAAGYEKDMERFLKANDGLNSRFAEKFHFKDYKPDELEQIFIKIASAESYSLSEKAKPLLSAVCKRMYESRDEKFGNGRDICNLFDEILKKQTVRISKLPEPVDKSAYSLIEAEDFPVEEKKEDSLEAALARLDNLIGLSSVKQEVRELINLLKVEKLRNNDGSTPKIGSHYIFTGNPGTGKTTVARILSDIFKNMGLLSKGHLVEKDRSGLIGKYVGDTEDKTQAVINEAMGGVLFIDEAYALVSGGGENDYGPRAVEVILKQMEDNKGKFIVIAAGYKNEMQRFLNSNPGLPERFQKPIEFPDYTPEELIAIFKSMVESKKMKMTPDFEQKMISKLTELYNKRSDTFANGRTVRNLFDEARKKQANRVAALGITDSTNPVLFTFEAEDLI